jgi:GntR family transcriptional regulator, mannosyl-D-glycerate transport/metabolism system repressor
MRQARQMTNKPMYRKIADTLRERIQRGDLKPGDALPTESALQEEFAVSRVTVRQALKQLTQEAIIESIQGSGSYVKEERVNYDIYQLTSFYEKLADRNVETHSDVRVFEAIDASPDLAAMLDVIVGAKIWHVKRVRFIKQKPVTLEETWMPLALFPDLTWEVMENSKYHFIEQVKKMVIDRSEQEIVPIMPSEEAVNLLGLDANRPILEKISRGFLGDGRVFEYSRNAFKSDDYKFTLIAKRRH